MILFCFQNFIIFCQFFKNHTKVPIPRHYHPSTSRLLKFTWWQFSRTYSECVLFNLIKPSAYETRNDFFSFDTHAHMSFILLYSIFLPSFEFLFLSHPSLRDLHTVASEHRTYHAMWLLYNASVYIDTTFFFNILFVLTSTRWKGRLKVRNWGKMYSWFYQNSIFSRKTLFQFFAIMHKEASRRFSDREVLIPHYFHSLSSCININ